MTVMNIDRRELLQRAMAALGGTLTASAAAGVLAGCAASAPKAGEPVAFRFFTPAEGAAATAMAEQILPRTDTPGAIDVGVPAFIDRMMADYYGASQQGVLRAGLARAEADALAKHQKPFAQLSAEQQIALMQGYDAEAYQQARATQADPSAQPHFFRIMKELTTLGYFTSEYGASQYLRYEPVPGPWRADIPYSEVGRAWAV
jgi:gluconate 2-dehydrogenase gamma chain